LPAGQIVGDYSADISFDAVTEILEIFNANDVPMEEPKVAVIGPRQVRQLMNLTEQTSSDYVQARALQQNGIVPNWMGFTWIMSTRLLTPATAQKDCLFFTRKALGFHLPEDIMTFVERDPGLSYAWRPYAQFTAGAVRVEDEHMVWLQAKDDSVP
jgi:Phage capsid protein